MKLKNQENVRDNFMRFQFLRLVTLAPLSLVGLAVPTVHSVRSAGVPTGINSPSADLFTPMRGKLAAKDETANLEPVIRQFPPDSTSTTALRSVSVLASNLGNAEDVFARITTTAQTFYVTDSTGRRLVRVRTNTSPPQVSSFATNLPTGTLGVTGVGSFFYVTHTGGRISRISSTGTVTPFVSGLSRLGRPAALSTGNLVVFETIDDRLLRISLTAKISNIFENDTLSDPIDVVPRGTKYALVDLNKGCLYIATPPSGLSTIACGLGRPESLVPLDTDSYIVSDSAGDRLLRVRVSTGRVTTVLRAGVATDPQGLALDRDKNIIVADGSSERLLRVRLR
uniref:NHL repeat containing protein n=1 Tax=Cyanothece sp. (strain PCC 7425 / ATCC 29141) TaxID=395961 RepID=B8HZ96_CYAP4